MREIPGGSRRSPSLTSFLAALSLALALLGGALALPSPARAVQPYSLSFADNDFGSVDPERRRLAFDRALELQASYVRIGAGWGSIATEEPKDPTDSEDPAYRFALLDHAVTEATERGLVPVITVASAPRWAEGANRPGWAPAGTWKPNAGALGLFARALASRYDGSHPDPHNPGEVLPRVDYYEVWNEPTLPKFLNPQWNGAEPKSPEIYRRMLNAFSANARDVQPAVKIVAGAMSPYGDGPGGRRMYPMRFLRELVCLRGRHALKPSRSCSARASFDILSSHPISPYTSPRQHAADPEDLAIADIGELRRILRTAERRGTVPAGPPRPLWVTEYWWETKPPENRPQIPSLSQQARWIAEAQLLLWKQGVAMAMLFCIADDPFDPDEPGASWQTGLYFNDGDPKPALAAARFPLAAERRSRKRVYVWTRPPESGSLAFQRRRGGEWRTVARAEVQAGVPLGRIVRMRGEGRLRAVLGDRGSYVWRQRG